MAKPTWSGDRLHAVHAERLEAGGARLWLDGQQLKGVQSYGLIEEIRELSRLTVTVVVDRIVWGAPPNVEVPRPVPVDDGRHHVVWTTADGRTTPSGKRACQTCGEAWMCSTATRRWELYGSTLVPPVTDREAELLERIERVSWAMLRFLEDGRMSTHAANTILGILRPEGLDKASDTPLD